MKRSNLAAIVGLLFLGASAGIILDRQIEPRGARSEFSIVPEARAAAAPVAPTTAAAPALQRTMLMTNDSPGAPGYEMIMGIVEVPPGASSGLHRHNGVEIGYILEGTAVMEHEGRPPATLARGGTFMNNGAHNAMIRGSAPAKILAVWVVEKGKTLAVPVP